MSDTKRMFTPVCPKCISVSYFDPPDLDVDRVGLDVMCAFCYQHVHHIELASSRDDGHREWFLKTSDWISAWLYECIDLRAARHGQMVRGGLLYNVVTNIRGEWRAYGSGHPRMFGAPTFPGLVSWMDRLLEGVP